MYSAMNSWPNTPYLAIPYFLIVTAVGSFVVLNLFVVIMLSAFDDDEVLEGGDSKVDHFDVIRFYLSRSMMHMVTFPLKSRHARTRTQEHEVEDLSMTESLLAMMRQMADDPCIKPCIRVCRGGEEDVIEDDIYDFSEHGGDAKVSAAVATRYRLDQDILDDVRCEIHKFSFKILKNYNLPYTTWVLETVRQLKYML